MFRSLIFWLYLILIIDSIKEWYKGSNLFVVEVEEGDVGDEGILYLIFFDGGGVKLDIIIIYKNKDIINCNDGLYYFEILK